MKIFISWSGARSRAVAELLNDWIKCVLQATRPWISTRHIDRGALWFSEISDQLKDTTVGVVCLTQENKDRPWILFEAGALAKGLSSNRVCTFLVDLQPADLVDPLAQFNHTLPNENGMRDLVRTLNGCLGPNALDERILDKVFEKYWPQFSSDFAAALSMGPPSEPVEPRSETNLLEEILENTRSLAKRMRALETDSSREVKADLRLPVDPRAAWLQDAIVAERKAGASDSDLIEILKSKYAIPPNSAASAVLRERLGRHFAIGKGNEGKYD